MAESCDNRACRRLRPRRSGVFFRVESGNPNGFVDLRLFNNKTYAGATISNFLLNGAAGTLLVALSLVQQGAGLSSLQSGC